MKYTYLILNLFTLLPVLSFSFDSNLKFYKSWKYCIPGILFTGLAFAVWDYYFTRSGVWQFNQEYVMDFRLFSMPLEEYLFFLFTPFACIFIYEATGFYLRPVWLNHASKPLVFAAATVCAGTAVSHTCKLYTSINFGIASGILLLAFMFLSKELLGRFWLAFIVHLIPFGVVNGVLTSWPVLIYDNSENLGIRVGTIPLEDIAYSLILFLSNLWAYNWLSNKNQLHEVQSESNH